MRESNRRWREENLDRARLLNRDAMRRAAVRQRRQDEVRARARERSKVWRVENGDRRREYHQAWVENNRDKVREYSTRYYEKHREEISVRAAARRDADPDHTKQTHKQWAERNKEHRAEVQRTRRSDPEIYQAELEANAATRRLQRTLAQAGLPPKRLHRTTAGERRSNERDADAYSSDPALPEHVRQFSAFAGSLTVHVLQNGARMRAFAQSYATNRESLGLPPTSLENIAYARAVEIVAQGMRRVDLLTSRDVAAAVRSTQAEVRRIERQRQYDRLVKTVITHTHRHTARLIDEARMENRARGLQGKDRLPVEALAVQIAVGEVVPRVPTSRLESDDLHSAARAALVRFVSPTAVPASIVTERQVQPPLG